MKTILLIAALTTALAGCATGGKMDPATAQQIGDAFAASFLTPAPKAPRFRTMCVTTGMTTVCH